MRARVVPARNAGAGNTVRARARTRLGTLAELFGFLLRGGRWWLLPMVVVFLLTGVLLGVVSALEYVAPFVYTVL
ncbi:MAG: hypothetical protein IT379_13905 [Deltaproteobacteria bacterium]|nr:hypothetical protein [Deltaproteobacteria bacterium]